MNGQLPQVGVGEVGKDDAVQLLHHFTAPPFTFLVIADVYEQHMESGADITAVCTSDPKGDTKSVDYFTMDETGRITDLAIRPNAPEGCETRELTALAPGP